MLNKSPNVYCRMVFWFKLESHPLKYDLGLTLIWCNGDHFGFLMGCLLKQINCRHVDDIGFAIIHPL